MGSLASLMTKRLLLYILLLFSNSVFAQQTTIIRGKVEDADNGDPLSYANITALPTSVGVGVLANEYGEFVLESSIPFNSIQATYIGYNPKTASIQYGKDQKVVIKLKAQDNTIESVHVKAKRVRYSNKNNPAVDLIRKAVENKDKNRLESHNYYQYEKHEKLEISLSDLSDSIKNSIVFKQYPFLLDYVDVSPITGKSFLPIYLREIVSENYYRQSPLGQKEIIQGQRDINFSKYIGEETISPILDGFVGTSNIYDNNVMILDNAFMSPLSSISPNFYRFHIMDTVNVSGTECIRINMYPRNSADFGFRGDIYLTYDSMCAVKKIDLQLTKNHSLNFVNDLSLIQEYELIGDTWCLDQDVVTIDFGIVGSKSPVLGKRTTTYRKYELDVEQPNRLYKGVNIVEKMPDYDARADEYWHQTRHIPLSNSEKGVYKMIDTLNSTKSFTRIMGVVGLVFSGYIEAGMFDIGNVESFISFNDVEGLRLRFGGKTNTKFSKHLFLEGFGAYGFGDDVWKYQAKATYSFNERKMHPWEFPMHMISASYEYNSEIPGQAFWFGTGDRLLLSFRRGKSDRMVYNRKAEVKYKREFYSGFSFETSLTMLNQAPAGELQFRTSLGERIHSYDIGQLGISLRYAPNERFYQVQANRFPLNHTHPVFTLTHHAAFKSIYGDYNLQRTEFGLDKRFWFSSYGFSDLSIKAGAVWTQVPFPLLVIHQANQNWAYQDEAYNMMNFMEFVSDYYASVNYSYNFNGLIFNRIPLVKKLKWREILTCKVLWGGITDKNDPYALGNEDLFTFRDRHGEERTFGLDGKVPYVEASFGIDNIFKVLRLDLIRRFTYMDNPDVPTWGLRFRLRFVF